MSSMDGAHTAADDAGARRRALDATRSFIVQAPAGSGKTELLTQRYLRLLTTVEQPEQILAITFTRKAAAEMRNRILAAIDSASGPAPELAHKRITWELARAVRVTDEGRGWGLREHPARLRIQTIDALNAALARRLPVLAGTGAALEPTDDPRPLYEAATARLLDRLGDGSPEARSIEALILHLGNRVDRLVALLCDLLAKRDQWLHPVVSAAARANLRATLERTLQSVIDHHLAQLCGALIEARRRELWALATYAAANLVREPATAEAQRRVLETCSNYAEAPGSDGRFMDAWRAVAEVFFRDDGQLYKVVNVKQGFPSGDAAMKGRMQRALAELAEDPELCRQLVAIRYLPRPAYSEEQWRILQALLDVLPLAVAELQVIFQAHAQADYIEAALRALQALGTSEEPTDLALAFDCRLQHLLVDEFQDTSFAQLDLLERLTAGWVSGEGRTVFCVGDPMQSIYRFRQAEVGLFLELQRRGLPTVPLEPVRLSANFRSTRSIIQWVNRVFPRVLAAADDPEQGAVKHSASVVTADGADGGVTLHPTLDPDDRAEAQRVTRIVREALQQDAQGRIAVLVTARSHVGLIASELSAASIEFQAIEIEALRARPVVQDLIALTRALVHLADRTAWLAVLRAPWCGLSLADLHALVGEDRSSTVNELLSRAVPGQDRLSNDGRARIERVHPVLQSGLSERGRWCVREWVERTWNALGGPATLLRGQDLDDVEAYLQRLDQIEIGGDLQDVARLEEQLERLFANPRPDSAARVEVMTIHKAKGLEFDTVILPSLHRWMRAEDRELLRWTRIAGTDGGIVFAPIKAEGQQPEPMYRWIELLERQRSSRERGRLLYVAATRAKRRLHLLGAAQVKDDEEGVRVLEPRHGSMLRLLWHEVAPAFEALARTAEPRMNGGSSASAPARLRRMPLAWQPPQADPPLHAPLTRVIEVALPQPEFDWVSETSRHVGTLVHRELERLVRSGVSRLHDAASVRRDADRQMTLFPPQEDPHAAAAANGAPAAAMLDAARPRLLAELAELGVPPERCESACARALAAIKQTLKDERGRWLLGLTQDIHDAQSELALSGVFNGQVVAGVIDRTFVDRGGVRWVVDFKTSVHEGGALDAFLDAEAERYRPQLVRYARLMRAFRPGEPVRAALYFPLLGQWREVRVDSPGNMTEVS